MAQKKTTKGTKKYPYRKLGIILTIIGLILVVVGFLLIPTDQDGLAAALVAWLPAGLALYFGIYFIVWTGKGGYDPTGSSGPL